LIFIENNDKNNNKKEKYFLWIYFNLFFIVSYQKYVKLFTL
jgi:hypothetical protein